MDLIPADITTLVQEYLGALGAAGICPHGAALIGPKESGPGVVDAYDLIVIAPELDGVAHPTLLDSVWRSVASGNCLLTPVACGTKEWDLPTQRPIIDIARREGVMIAPRAA